MMYWWLQKFRINEGEAGGCTLVNDRRWWEWSRKFPHQWCWYWSVLIYIACVIIRAKSPFFNLSSTRSRQKEHTGAMFLRLWSWRWGTRPSKGNFVIPGSVKQDILERLQSISRSYSWRMGGRISWNCTYRLDSAPVTGRVSACILNVSNILSILLFRVSSHEEWWVAHQSLIVQVPAWQERMIMREVGKSCTKGQAWCPPLILREPHNKSRHRPAQLQIMSYILIGHGGLKTRKSMRMLKSSKHVIPLHLQH